LSEKRQIVLGITESSGGNPVPAASVESKQLPNRPSFVATSHDVVEATPTGHAEPTPGEELQCLAMVGTFVSFDPDGLAELPFLGATGFVER
jgi:hypothetical protein